MRRLIIALAGLLLLAAIIAVIAVFVVPEDEDSAGGGTSGTSALDVTGAESVEQAAERIRAVLSEQGLSDVLTIDHAGNAARVGLDLRPTRLIIFDDLATSAPLIESSLTAGIDFPLKVLVWEDENGAIQLAFNGPDYLAQRHRIAGQDNRLDRIGALSAQLGENAVDGGVDDDNGLITVAGTRSVIDTAAAIQRAIEEAGFAIPLIIDHEIAARNVGTELRPMQLIVFGNPNVGTRLMQVRQSIGLDLPQKMLIWEATDGSVNITYNDPFFIARRHGVEGMDDVLTNVANALNNFAQAGANPA